MISLHTVGIWPSKRLVKGISEISFDLLSLVLATLYTIFIPSQESNFAYRSSYAASLAILTAFLLALFASLNFSLFSSLLFIWNCLNVALFKATAFRVSSCHHQVSFSVYVPFPVVSPKTYFAVSTRICFISCQSRLSTSLRVLCITASVFFLFLHLPPSNLRFPFPRSCHPS